MLIPPPRGEVRWGASLHQFQILFAKFYKLRLNFYQYHYYQFTDDKYKLDSTTDRYTELKDRIYRTQVGGETIEVVVEYKISVYTQGTIVGSRNILNSNYSKPLLEKSKGGFLLL